MKKSFWLIPLFVGCVLATVFCMYFISRSKENYPSDYKTALQLLSEKKFDQAGALIELYLPEMEKGSSIGDQWMSLYIRYNQLAGNEDTLGRLYQFNSDLFNENEEWAIVAANHLIYEKKYDEYLRLRARWRQRESKGDSWFLLDADALVLDGRISEAIDYLRSHSLQGSADVGRLLRIALLFGINHPNDAWQALNLAYQKSAGSTEVIAYKGRFLESIGKNARAHQEYQTAYSIAPDSEEALSNLLEFYLRQQKYMLALSKLERAKQADISQELLAEMFFWNKLTTPVIVDWNGYVTSQNTLKPYFNYLINLPQTTYWDHGSFMGEVPYAKAVLTARQETYWLRLLQALIDGKEEEAIGFIQYNPFATVSWRPDIEDALWKTLIFRQNKRKMPLENIALSNRPKKPQSQNPEFFLSLNQEFLQPEKPISDELERLLLSDQAYSAIFLAAGLPEVALSLNPQREWNTDLPEWFGIKFAQALRTNRDVSTALKYLQKYPFVPSFSLVQGELLIESNQEDAALKVLIPVSKEITPEGKKAAWLVSLLYFDSGNYLKAEEVIKNHPILLRDIQGQETLARIANQRGDIAEAERIYRSIEHDSFEARSYFAKRAYLKKEYNQAEHLTSRLLEDYPAENALLKENLKTIRSVQNLGY